MTPIEQKVNKFFVEILSYCALNKQKNVNIFNKLSKNSDELLEVNDWVHNIINRRYFVEDIEQPKLIYYLFPDKETVRSLESIFYEIKFDSFIEYFKFCQTKIEENNVDAELELFSHINFFHLIGSLRFFKKDNENQIIEILKSILESDDFPKLIKYSALQITTLISHQEKVEGPIQYKYKEIFKNEYFEILNHIETNDSSLLVKYISFYSIYYYDNEFNSKQLINNKYLDRVIEQNKIDFNYLHTFIPQIASQLIRLDLTTYNEKNIGMLLRELFEISDETLVQKIKDFQNNINNWYKDSFND